jgi:tight adherence protein B
MSFIIFAAILGAIGLIIIAYLAYQSRREVSDRVHYFVKSDLSPNTSVLVNPTLPDQEGDTYLTRFRRQFNLVFAILNSEEMQKNLIAANWRVTVSEYLFIRFGAATLSFFLGLLIFKNIFPGIGFAVVVYLLPGFFVFRSVQKRQKLFQDQLLDTLTLIRGAVGAGYSFQQSVNVIVQEMASPTSDEFRQVRREVELGLPLSRALTNMADRMENDDFLFVVTVVNINAQVGGNLTTILNVVIETIRQRIYLFSEMRSLTAYANFAGYLLTLMPFFTIAALAILNPDYWEQLFQPGLTRYVLIYAACSLIVGNIVLRRISRFQV